MKNKKNILFILFISFGYLIGAVTIKYELPPYNIVKSIYNQFDQDHEQFDQDHELDLGKDELNSELGQHFINPIINSQKLRYPPVTSREQLNERINEMFINIDLFSAYDKIHMISNVVEDNVFIGVYSYKSKIDTVFAYFIRNDNNKNIGINIIPGSGINQSSQIIEKNRIQDNYQSNIDNISLKYGDVYVLIKPNEDILAIHNGHKKIGSVSFVNYLINKGGSYSSYYILKSLALSKFINKKYDKLYIMGLSQGGLAALINAIESRPDKAIIASGFTYFMSEPYRSSHNQIIIPDYQNLDNPEKVYEEISKSTTNFLFTWGLDEQGLYGKDAHMRTTQNFFKPLPNVKSIIHKEGHVYYEPAIIEFLSSGK